MTFIALGEAVNLVRATSRPESIDESAPVLGLEDIESHTGILGEPALSASTAKSSKAAFRCGDVLFAKLRPTLRKVVVAPYDGLCTTELVVLRPLDEESTWFLWSILRSEQFLAAVMPLVSGASLPRISPKELLTLSVPWPDDKRRHHLSLQAEAVHQAQVRSRRLVQLLGKADSSLSAQAWVN
jgi:type I restriction enzyme S subunit